MHLLAYYTNANFLVLTTVLLLYMMMTMEEAEFVLYNIILATFV